MNQALTDHPVLSVVIPLYCEGTHLEILVSKIHNILDSLEKTYELIMIDDGSTDNTWSVLEEVSKKHTFIKSIKLSRNFGKESAICAGLENASGKAIIVMDGDLQHPPEIIPKMFQLWNESKADVVQTVKKNRGKESFFNKFSALFFYKILKNLSGYDLTNLTDYKLMDRKVVKAWLQMGERNLFFRGMSEWVGFKHINIPIEVPERASGKSGMSTHSLMKLAVTAATSFSSKPLHLVTIIGMLFLLFSLFLGAQTLYMKFYGAAVSGFTTVILLQLVIGSLIMISLGIIGEYIARIYNEVKRRPRYVVSKIIGKIERTDS